MTGAPLHVLLLSSPMVDPAAARELAAAGHRVTRCHEVGASTFPCNALRDDGHCPIDAGEVDVAVVVRDHPWPRPMQQEDGAVCAVRRGLPLVVGGRTALHPYDGYAARVVDGVEGLAAACAEACAESRGRYAFAAAAAATSSVRRAGHAGAVVDAQVSVDRLHRRIELRCDVALTPQEEGRAAVRAMAAVRELDPFSDQVEVVFAGRPPGAAAG